MKDLALDCFLSGKSAINPCKRRNSFEFVGFDFMIDEDFRVWLIEVNTNPYIDIYNDGMMDMMAAGDADDAQPMMEGGMEDAKPPEMMMDDMN